MLIKFHANPSESEHFYPNLMCSGIIKSNTYADQDIYSNYVLNKITSPGTRTGKAFSGREAEQPKNCDEESSPNR